MNSTVTIYHGSEKIIEKPVFGEGKRHNDFGPGFYCTENEDLAKEWAVTKNRNGYVNKYSLNTECLNILYLNSEQYTILNWIATLVNNRVFTLNNPVANRARRYIVDNFSVNVNAYDLIIGYRADDSYFDYAQAFLNNTITFALENLHTILIKYFHCRLAKNFFPHFINWNATEDVEEGLFIKLQQALFG